MPEDSIIVYNAREHNLRGINLTIPKGSLTVLTGVSGSGKSSLAFDTLFAEGQRRYVESLSPYARQFMQQLPRPAVERIEGLAPAIAIDQSARSHNPRSTVATVTEIYDHLRVLYAAIGVPHCPDCKIPIGACSREVMVGRLMSLPAGEKVQVLAPVVRGRRGEFAEMMADMAKRGYARARVDGEMIRLLEPPALDRYRRHDIDIVIDRLTVGPEIRHRAAEAVDGALELADGNLIILRPGEEEIWLSGNHSCSRCDRSFEPLSHASFSFNNPRGMCPTCQGLGIRRAFDPGLLVPDPRKSLPEGAIPLLRSITHPYRRHWYEGVAAHYGFDIETPWDDLAEEHRRVLLDGSGNESIAFYYRNPRRGWEWRHEEPWPGILRNLYRRYSEARAPSLVRAFEAAMRIGPCPDCGGRRLRPESLAVTVGGQSIAGVTAMDVATSCRFFDELTLSATETVIAEDAFKEIRERLHFLENVGLGYITLDRPAPSLSGGEAQRIRLAGQVGSGLADCLYVLDEPSIGLHPRDQGQLLQALYRLRDLGNTVVVVEHDEQTIRAADYVVDFGPGAGERGGRIITHGTPSHVARDKSSLTGQYLRGALQIPLPKKRREGNGAVLHLSGATLNNLKDITVQFPLGCFIAVTGVSGSGKSSLVTDTLYPLLSRELMRAQLSAPPCGDIEGLEHLDKVILIDQDPIGRTPRSNPATYTGVFDLIRALYAQLPEAQARGYRPGRFSFNVPEGRCQACDGHGAIRLESDFLAEVWVPCEVCEGRRFDEQTLEITFKGASIADVLAMEISEARAHFKRQPRIERMLGLMEEIGLGYIRLGQPATTLSGGEAQRVKLALELMRPRTGRCMYILDEPTTGLHFHDVRQLLEILHRFADEGNTVVVVEHHPDVMKTADYVLEMGPEGGDAGGRVVACGTPEEVARCTDSHTAEVLREALGETPPQSTSLRRPRRRQRPQETKIVVRGAREHNLKNINVTIPRHRMTVVSGVSGSGKTSLALDTVYAEGQRRYAESLSSYARQFINQMPKPKVDRVSGLAPAIAIEQGGRGYSSRSTVGTATEIYDYLRVLYARLGIPHCHRCSAPVGARTVDEVVGAILADCAGATLTFCAPLRPRGSETYDLHLERAARDGWQRVRVDGELHTLPFTGRIDRRRRHSVEIVTDRFAIHAKRRSRIAEAVEKAFAVGDGELLVVDGEKEIRYSSRHSCSGCGANYAPLSPRSFSFNHPEGWCPACQGLGIRRGRRQAAGEEMAGGNGAADLCQVCRGVRIRPEPAHVKWRGRTIGEVCAMSLEQLHGLFSDIALEKWEQARAGDVLAEIRRRSGFLVAVGLEYLSLARSAPTLSGGEIRRVRLAGQLGADLTGVLYVLDEPTVGVHPAQNARVLEALHSLRDEGNTVVVVEHDPQTLAAADYLVDCGPGAGPCGGQVVAAGTGRQLVRRRQSLTGGYMAGRLKIPLPQKRRPVPPPPEQSPKDWLVVRGARHHNLKNIDVAFPLGVLACVTGPSGAGKSSLVHGIVHQRLAIRCGAGNGSRPGDHDGIDGLKSIDQVISIDQTPIGGTPRSNPVTYVGAFDDIRAFFAELPESRVRGFKPGRFSFNKPGGRCESCAGMGSRCVEMHFLPDVWVTCEECGGKRFNPETLEVRYHGKSIADVLEMSIDEAGELFAAFPRLARKLQMLGDVGLGYLPVGQAAPSLSGGEAQRVKLARELARPVRGHTLYLLDEPTTGLHPADIATLLEVLGRLVDRGHSVIVIEHNLDFIKSADYVIDIGPEGGSGGGFLLAAGTPEEVVATEGSPTAPWLGEYINGTRGKPPGGNPLF